MPRETRRAGPTGGCTRDGGYPRSGGRLAVVGGGRASGLSGAGGDTFAGRHGDAPVRCALPKPALYRKIRDARRTRPRLFGDKPGSNTPRVGGDQRVHRSDREAAWLEERPDLAGVQRRRLSEVDDIEMRQDQSDLGRLASAGRRPWRSWSRSRTWLPPRRADLRSPGASTRAASRSKPSPMVHQRGNRVGVEHAPHVRRAARRLRARSSCRDLLVTLVGPSRLLPREPTRPDRAL